MVRHRGSDVRRGAGRYLRVAVQEVTCGTTVRGNHHTRHLDLPMPILRLVRRNLEDSIPWLSPVKWVSPASSNGVRGGAENTTVDLVLDANVFLAVHW